MKKLLTLLTALSMALTLVPGLTLTVSAADAPEINVNYFVGDNHLVFNGNGNIDTAWGDGQQFGSPEANAAGWTGWNSDNENLRLFKIGTTFIAADAPKNGIPSSTVYTLTAPDEIFNKTKDKDYIVFEWTGNNNESYSANFSNETYFDVAYTNGKTAFDAFRYTKHTDGINYQKANTGNTPDNQHPFADYATGYTYTDSNLDGDNNADTGNGSNAAYATYRMVYINDNDGDGYTASYYYNNNTGSGSPYVLIGTKTFAHGKADGFKEMKISDMSQDLRINNFKIYAGDFTGLETYTVSYVSGDTTLGTKTVYVDEKSSAMTGYNGLTFANIDIPYFEGYVFNDKTYNTNANTLTLDYKPVSSERFFDNVDNDTTLISLNMLGAHDAFTSKVDTKRDGAAIDRGESGAAYAHLAPTMSKAQSANALSLLDYGVRYFDIRLTRSDATRLSGTTAQYGTNAEFYTSHNSLSDEFRDVAVTVAQWAKQHPGEIIVLDFQEIWDGTTDGANGTNAKDNRNGNTKATWEDLDYLLRETGIMDFVTIGNGSVSDHTYGSLTQNGSKANIILFGRSNSTGVGKFIMRGNSNADGKAGYVFSNYTPSDGTRIGTSFKPEYINSQIKDFSNLKDNPITWMFRVMQAQSESLNLITQAAKDNVTLTEGLKKAEYSDWLSSLPVVMVNDAVTNTDGLLALLKECNTGKEITVNYKIGSETVTKKVKGMVGTLFDGFTKYAISNKADGSAFYVADDSAAAFPVPYGDKTVDINAVALGNVFTVQKDETANTAPLVYVEDGSSSVDTNFSAYNWINANTLSNNNRFGVAVLDVQAGHDFYTLDGTQLRDTAFHNNSNPNNHNTVSIYAVSYEDYKKLDLSDYSAVTSLFTDTNKVCSYDSETDDDNTAKAVSFNLDANKFNKLADKGGKVVIFGVSHGGLYRLKNDIHITGKDLPTLTPTLGWNEENNAFTIDFMFGEGETGSYTVNVYRDAEKTGSAQVTLDADVRGTAFAPASSNAVYTAKAANADGVEGEASVKAGIYSLVAEAIENGNFGEGKSIKAAQADAAAKVITAGGVYMKDGKLDEYTAKVLDLTENGVKIKDELYAAGLKFAAGSAKYVAADGSEQDVTVTEGAQEIIIPNFTTQETDDFTLNEIEFVFEPEGISETDTDSGEIDFVEEI